MGALRRLTAMGALKRLSGDTPAPPLRGIGNC